MRDNAGNPLNGVTCTAAGVCTSANPSGFLIDQGTSITFGLYLTTAAAAATNDSVSVGITNLDTGVKVQAALNDGTAQYAEQT